MEESKTYLKNIAMPPKKLRFYLESVKKMKPSTALDHLFYGRQKATRILYQAVKSAISNAKQTLKVNDDLLNFKVLTVEEGQKLKRYRPGSKGTPKPIVRRRSHIKIILVKTENNKSQMTNDKSISKSKLQINKKEKK
ncbi:MAG: uL22 family ribosomal protein [Candidatus Roizmanbacteria bacterium]